MRATASNSGSLAKDGCGKDILHFLLDPALDPRKQAVCLQRWRLGSLHLPRPTRQQYDYSMGNYHNIFSCGDGRWLNWIPATTLPEISQCDPHHCTALEYDLLTIYASLLIEQLLRHNWSDAAHVPTKRADLFIVPLSSHKSYDATHVCTRLSSNCSYTAAVTCACKMHSYVYTQSWSDTTHELTKLYQRRSQILIQRPLMCPKHSDRELK